MKVDVSMLGLCKFGLVLDRHAKYVLQLNLCTTCSAQRLGMGESDLLKKSMVMDEFLGEVLKKYWVALVRLLSWAKGGRLLLQNGLASLMPLPHTRGPGIYKYRCVQVKLATPMQS